MPAATVTTVFGWAIAAGALAVCFIAWLTAVELRAEAGDQAPMRSDTAAGFAAGVGVWALPLLSGPADPSLGYCPAVMALSLPVTVVLALCAFGVERRFKDARGLIGGGALFGTAIAVSQGLTAFGLARPAGADVNDLSLITAVAVANPLAVGAVVALRRLPDAAGRLTAVGLFTSATWASFLLDRGAAEVMPEDMTDSRCSLPALPAADMTLIAGLVLALVLLHLRRFGAVSALTPATRVLAWRGSRPPAQARPRP